MQAVQVPPHPVRRASSSIVRRSASIRCAASSKDISAHSQRVIACPTQYGPDGSSEGRGVQAIRNTRTEDNEIGFHFQVKAFRDGCDSFRRMRAWVLAGAAVLGVPMAVFAQPRAVESLPPMAYQEKVQTPVDSPRFRLVIHGGAGAVARDRRTPELEAAVRAALTESLQAGHKILAAGGPALDAVEAAIRVLEDSPHFNAGKGAVFTSAGTNELDASIMDGATRRAGAVAALKRIRNPITLARRVMEHSRHVLLVGEGAEAFAREQGIEWVDPSYFHTERRWEELREAQEREKTRGDAGGGEILYGTVGAVALDASGHLAAGTSTGGMTNKRFGRVGDSPIIGAGTYADAACAVSSTGKGEFYLRAVAAYDVCARVAYKGASLQEAAEAVLAQVASLGGEGGLIAVDAAGNVALPFNTPAMYRGHVDAAGRIVVAIDRD